MKAHPPDKLRRRPEIRDLRRLTAGLVHHRAPAFSTDGHWLCLQSGEREEAAWLVCDHKGRPARVLAGPAEGAAAFAPDRTLAYGRRRGATTEIWALSSGSPTPQLLLGGDGRFYRDPAFSPDGQTLCCAADWGEGGPLHLELRSMLGGARGASPLCIEGAVVHSPAPMSLVHPAFCPGGDRLYCEGQHDEDSAIYVVLLPPAGPRLLRLTPQGVRARRPAPVAPGLLVCECEGDDGDSDLWLLRYAPDAEAEGGTLPAQMRRLAVAQAGAREPAVAFRKGRARLACALWTEGEEGEPRRYDLYTGRLCGLPRGAGGGA